MARAPGPFATGAFYVVDLLDRVWRRCLRMLDRAVVAWHARRG